MSVMAAVDTRVAWIEDQVVIGLKISNEVFKELLTRDPTAKKTITDYLDGNTSGEEAVLFFYAKTGSVCSVDDGVALIPSYNGTYSFSGRIKVHRTTEKI